MLSDLYSNQRFGYSLDIPVSFTRNENSMGGNGLGAQNSDGICITVWGIANPSQETVSGSMTKCAYDIDTVIYKAQGDNWYVLGGIAKDRIVYFKTFVGRASINTLLIRYPKKLGDSAGRVADGILRSFKQGELDTLR